MADDQQQRPDEPRGDQPPDTAGLDQTREFPAPDDEGPGDEGSGGEGAGGEGSGGEGSGGDGPGDETVVMPASGDQTAVFPAATAWSGRAGVPPPEATAVPEPVWPEPGSAGRRWWSPVVLGLLALVLLAIVGLGLWLALRDVEDRSTPGTPGASASSTPTKSSRSSAAAPTTHAEPTRNTVPVPRLVGMDSETAQSVLDNVGLTYQLSFRPSATAAPGTVLEVDPGEGTEVDKGSQVTLVLASAPPSTAAATPSATRSATATPTD